MNKTIMGVIVGVGAVVALAGGIWATSSCWHGYCADEKLFEAKQAELITKAIETADYAMKQSTQMLLQNRQLWLEQRLIAFEKDFGGEGVPTAPASVKKLYKRYKLEYDANQKKLDTLIKEGT